MLAAVQIFNNPLVPFKSELFIVISVIAWTYLLHANYKKQKVEYRYKDPKTKKLKKTKGGDFVYWGLEECLSYLKCPLDKGTKDNLH